MSTKSLLLVLALAGLSLHRPAQAAIPTPARRNDFGVPPVDPAHCTIPSHIVLMGTSSFGSPDPYGEFCVTLRGYSNEPIPATGVIVSFTNCPDVRFAQDQKDPAMGVLCNEFSKETDANGQACFRLTGVPASPGAGCAPRLMCYIASIQETSTYLGSPLVSTIDLDGTGGVTAADLSAWLDIYFGGSNCGLADFDGDGAVRATDLSIWLQYYNHHSSVKSAAPPLCP